ncbi:hypothetical protein Slin15195_G082780 [Septoria linicola]|uniref:Sulfotransferase n=1 Tax=Septoria linicola TaxID=215465 RepID=A0A9Q9EM13_9PEZI|nr:hypothetical protein Slin15195_G082780 [Septoria linicola]
MAVTDIPCVIFYRELLAAYPDAKVILTVRDSPEQWMRSRWGTIVQFMIAMEGPKDWVGKVLVKLFGPREDVRDGFARRLVSEYEMYDVLMRDWREGTRESVEWYQRYVEEVKRLVPEEKLLVMNVKEGWSPLCRFLGKDVPPWDFPKVNSTEEFQHNGQLYAQYCGNVMKRNMLSA